MRYFTIILLSIILFTGCNKSSDSTGPALTFSTFTSISGKLESWTGGGTGSFVKMISEFDNSTSLGQSAVDASGNFSINPVADLPNSHMNALAGNMPSGLTADNQSTRTGSALLSLFSSGGNPLYLILEGKFTNLNQATVGDFYAMYIFSDGNAKITGIHTETEGSSTFKYVYNVQLTKGWNKVVQKLTNLSGNNQDWDVSNSFPETPKFYMSGSSK